ncbi:TonB-dependent receptor [Stenotrophomonas pictorum JCM 9942]|uniref:TonB-dependent receptor n=1 Tax=Stenotrophomonas pictorum JCM 9942 TaxID=1236960 RepID=A0A0R0AAT6_9GAMM|nr:TonB-dependent copper receptor [Stenotrophomonas pictorum]KRG41561.1 TonB-dependent receptor [Stenotrophomonas pictorum JCM 9942]
MSHPVRPAPRASWLSLAIASALASPFGVQAAAPDPVDFEAVVVTASPVSPLTYETDPKLPRQPVPASDGADYLKTIPGFSAVRNGGTNGDPVLRGMFGSRLNLLTNDGSMPGACPARMDNPMSYVSPETYDRLVVIKGPQTVRWGPGASAGTVRFERRTPRFDTPGIDLTGSLLGGSFGRNDQVLDATAGMPVGYARLSANRSESDDYRDGSGDVVPSSWKKWNTDLALGWTPDADTLLEFNAGVGDGSARYAGRGMDGAQFKRQSYSLRFEKSNLPGSLERVEASVFANYADHVMDNYTLRTPNPMSSMPMPMVAQVDRRTLGGRNAWTWATGGLELTAGIDGQQSRHRERGGMGRNAHLAMPWVTDANFQNAGLFAEATWTLSAARRLVSGARADRAEVTDKRTVAGMMGRPNPTAGLRRKETLPAAFMRFEQDTTSTRGTWYAGLGHTARMPDYWELFSPDRGPMGAVNAFAGIHPEKTTQLDVGLQYRAPTFDAWVSAYAGRIQDYIIFAYMEGGMMGMMSSAANVDADIRGGEAGVEFRPAPHWKLGGTLAYAWGENRASGDALPQMPPLEARLSAGYDNRRWNAGVLVRAVSRQTRVALNQGTVVGRDIGPSAGFATLALNGGYRFTDRVQLTAGVDNLFDRAYSEHLNLSGSADFGYPADPLRFNEPGRSAWVKLNVDY